MEFTGIELVGGAELTPLVEKVATGPVEKVMRWSVSAVEREEGGRRSSGAAEREDGGRRAHLRTHPPRFKTLA